MPNRPFLTEITILSFKIMSHVSVIVYPQRREKRISTKITLYFNTDIDTCKCSYINIGIFFF